MPKITSSKKFQKEFKKLPPDIQQKTIKLLKLLVNKPTDAKLHQKLLKGKLAGFYSFRVTRDYRCLYLYTDENTIEILSIKHRKDIYK